MTFPVKSHWPKALRKNAPLIALLGSTMLASSPALAQQASAGQSVDEVIVTAQKREENIQSVPISIQALGTEKLAQHQVTRLDDFVKLLPSVSYQSDGPGRAQIYFRGISSGSDGARTGPSPTVGLYVDDIPLTTIANSIDLHVYDIDRVEALAGPQGTLFGASSLAGTLRLITAKPKLGKFEGGADVEVNKFGAGDFGGLAEGFINLPLSSRVALRISAFYQHDGGYIDNIPGVRTYTLADANPATNLTVNNARFVKNNYNDLKVYGGRAALGIDLDDNWTVTPAIIYQHQVANGTFLFDRRFGDLKVNHYTPEFNKDSWYLASLTIQGKIGNWDLVYAGGYLDHKVTSHNDYSEYTVAYDQFQGSHLTDFVDINGNRIDPTQSANPSDRFNKMSHELRVSSSTADRFRIVAGAFLQRQTDEQTANFVIPGLGRATPPIFVVPTTVDSIFYTRASRVDRDYALFTQADFDITDQLTLTAGVRGFSYKNTAVGFSGLSPALSRNSRPPNCLPTTRTDLPCIQFDKKASGSGETHKVTLTYKVDADRLVYATYSTGFRPGGINRVFGIASYGSDTLANYELGWKTSWFDRRLRLNGAVFHEKWDGLQFGLAGVNGIINTYNAGGARVSGAEADFNLRLADGLTLSGSGTYIDAKLSTDLCRINASQNIDCSLPGKSAFRGDRLPLQPKFKGSSTARYEFPLGSIESFVQGSVNYQGMTLSRLTRVQEDLLGPAKAFTTFDFSVGGTIATWTVEAFMQNAFDARGQINVSTPCNPTFCSGAKTILPIKPQFFGVKVGTRF